LDWGWFGSCSISFSCVGFLHSLFAAAVSFFLLQSVSRSIFVLLERWLSLRSLGAPSAQGDLVHARGVGSPFYLCARYRFSFEFLSARALRLHGFLAGLFQAPVVRAMDLDSWTWFFPGWLSLPPSAQVLLCSVSVSALIFPARSEGSFDSCFFTRQGCPLVVIFPPVGHLPEVLPVQIPFSNEDFVRPVLSDQAIFWFLFVLLWLKNHFAIHQVILYRVFLSPLNLFAWGWCCLFKSAERRWETPREHFCFDLSRGFVFISAASSVLVSSEPTDSSPPLILVLVSSHSSEPCRS
jgi:hypothetical protein